jgi:hypothetical protein
MQKRQDALDENGQSKADSVRLQWICRSVLESLSEEFSRFSIEARYYHYIGLSHTIRRKGSRWVVRISDHCMGAPDSVLESIVKILGCKVLRRRLPEKALAIYERFRKSPRVEESVRRRRRAKGRKHIAGEMGKHHSLRGLFRELNRRYFNDQIEVRLIGWGCRKSWSRLGHYDPVHHTITISPALDSPVVPVYVMQYLVYHEMLHAAFQDASPCSLHRHHPPEFRHAERAYPDFGRAQKFLKDFCARRGK